MRDDYYDNRVGNLGPGEHSQPGRHLRRLDDGAPVFDIDGQRIGTMSLRETGDYLVILAPDISDGRLYLPLSAINRSDADGIHLSLSRADLTGDHWTVPPMPG
jgi:hypothetical protein